MINIANATNKTVKIVDRHDKVIFTFEPVDYTPDIKKISKIVGNIENIKFTSVDYGEVTGLPAPVTNMFFIVSSEIKDHANRLDLICPDQIISDTCDDVVVCKTFRI